MRKRSWTFLEILCRKAGWKNIVDAFNIDMGETYRQEYWHAQNKKIAKSMENMFNIFSGFMIVNRENIMGGIYSAQLPIYSEIIKKKNKTNMIHYYGYLIERY